MATEKVKRKLAAILSADVKGYSRLMGEDEEGTLQALRSCKEVMVNLFRQYGGRVVGTAGDSLLVEFASVVDAVKCGVEIQKELRSCNADLTEERRMEFRIGINLGDMIEEEDTIYGDGVNIAARVQSLAGQSKREKLGVGKRIQGIDMGFAGGVDSTRSSMGGSRPSFSPPHNRGMTEANMKFSTIKRISTAYFIILLISLFHSSLPCAAEPKMIFPPMTQYIIPDPYLGCPAWTFVAPRDWIKQGGVVWTGGMAPAYYTELLIRNPQGAEEFRLFPIFIFAETAYPVMANGAEIRRYTDAVSCIREILIPRCRPEIRQGKVIARELLPQIAQQAAERVRGLGIPGLRADSARMLTEYPLQDRTMEEMFYCITIAGQAQNVINWGIDRGFSYRAEKGKLEAAFPVLGRIGGSLYENPEWVVKRREELARRVASRSRPPQTISSRSGPSILDVSKGMSKAQDEFLKGLHQSSAARDRATEPWTDAFRGVQARHNPTTGETVYVPNGYQRYYEDNLGRRFGSNDMIGDPYVNYHINATELQPAAPRR